AGVILNKIRQDQWPQPPGERLPGSELPLLACIPWQDELNAVRTCDIVEAVQARVLNEGESRLRRVQQLLLCASSAPRLATDLQAGTLLGSPVDRGAVLVAAARAGMNGTPLAGLLLCGSDAPEPALLELCTPALQGGLPLLSTRLDCASALLALNQLSREIPADDQLRAEQLADSVADRLSPEWFRQRSGQAGAPRLTPARRRAQAANKRIVLPEGSEPRTVQAAAICQARGIARCVLLAKPEEVQSVARAHGIELPEGLEILDPEAIRERYVEPMVELRKGKG